MGSKEIFIMRPDISLFLIALEYRVGLVVPFSNSNSGQLSDTSSVYLPLFNTILSPIICGTLSANATKDIPNFHESKKQYYKSFY